MTKIEVSKESLSLPSAVQHCLTQKPQKVLNTFSNKGAGENQPNNPLFLFLKIWLGFWVRCALYFCVVAFLIGTSLSFIFFYKLSANLDFLLILYTASSLLIWFCLTPLALYLSLKKSTFSLAPQ